MSPDQARWLQGRPFIFQPNTAPLFSSIIHESPLPACLIPLASWSSPPPTLNHTWTSRKSGYSLNIRGIGCGLMREGREEGRGFQGYMEPWFEVFNSWITPSTESKRGMTLIHFFCLPPILFLFLSRSPGTAAKKQSVQFTHTSSLSVCLAHTLLNTPRHWKTCTPSLATHWAPLTSHNTLGYSCSKVIVLNRQTTSLRVVRSEAPPWDCKTRENVHLPLQKQNETHTPQGFHHIKKPLQHKHEGFLLHTMSTSEDTLLWFLIRH